MRRALATVLLALAFLLASCNVVEETKAGAAINAYRITAGVAPLVRSDGLDRNAAWQAARMAHRKQVFHTTDLKVVGQPGWTIVGENVASATTIEAAILALEESPPHRKNLLEPRFKRFGVAVVIRDGVFYLVQLFEG